MLISCLLIFMSAQLSSGQATTTSQSPDNHRRDKQEAFATGSEGLLDRARPALLRAKDLMKKKKYVEAEAACAEARGILTPARFLQDIPDCQLARIYEEEGKDEAAIKLWSEIYRRMPGEDDYALELSISYAKLNKAEESYRYVSVWLNGKTYPKTDVFDFDDLPIAKGINSDNLKATGLLLRAWNGGDDIDEKLTDLKAAYSIAPRNGNINYQLALYNNVYKQDWKAAIPYYRAAFHYGNEQTRTTSKIMLKQLGQPLSQ
jgi:tetratricopeptide (TPR) repeat protein